MRNKRLILWLGLAMMGWLGFSLTVASGAPWQLEKADRWYRKQAWPVGCNFTPSTAINQLEMWQPETFDTNTIDRELGWAQQIGFNTVRVFLHNLLWTQDSEGFLKRMDQFLTIADRHHIKVMFVTLDSVWDPAPKLGKQREPKAGLHNSGWVQSPGADILKDPAKQDELKGYIQGVLRKFKMDQRILAWDLYNEPDNANRPAYETLEPTNKAELALALLEKTFGWARQVNPSQPLTCGLWIGTWKNAEKMSAMEHFILDQSDVITFHNYGDLAEMKECVANLKRYQRPMICTEYMARPRGSTFDPILGYLQSQKVGALNWGFVAGKTGTIYPWDSWQKAYAREPKVWFHDIFRTNGTPFDQHEIDYIKSVTQKNNPDGK